MIEGMPWRDIWCKKKAAMTEEDRIVKRACDRWQAYETYTVRVEALHEIARRAIRETARVCERIVEGQSPGTGSLIAFTFPAAFEEER